MYSRLLLALVTFAVSCAPLSARAADATPSEHVLVAAGTEVPVQLVGSLSSSSAKPGDRFSFRVAHDIVSHGMVVIAAGANGEGVVNDVDHAGGNGHSGSLSLHFEWVHAADGGKVVLGDSPMKAAEEDRKGASSTATIIGFATFGVGGLFGHNLARGREVTIDGRKTLSAFVAENVHVDTSTLAMGEQYDH